MQAQPGNYDYYHTPEYVAYEYERTVAQVIWLQQWYYYGEPRCTDEEYDGLWRYLVAFEANHPEVVREDSPTNRVAPPPLSSVGLEVTSTDPVELANFHDPVEEPS